MYIRTRIFAPTKIYIYGSTAPPTDPTPRGDRSAACTRERHTHERGRPPCDCRERGGARRVGGCAPSMAASPHSAGPCAPDTQRPLPSTMGPACGVHAVPTAPAGVFPRGPVMHEARTHARTHAHTHARTHASAEAGAPPRVAGDCGSDASPRHATYPRHAHARAHLRTRSVAPPRSRRRAAAFRRDQSGFDCWFSFAKQHDFHC